MPLTDLLKIKILIQRDDAHINEGVIDEWPFYILEENIKIITELNEERRKAEEKQSAEQQQSYNLPKYDSNSMMNNVNNMMKNIPKF